MKLDFNDHLKNLRGLSQGVKAVDAIQSVLEMGSTQDERYLDKKKEWAKSLDKTGTIEIDKVDAEVLKDWIINSSLVDYAKIYLKEYIKDRIAAAVPESKKK
jgi:hypothetical protein